ncbi:MAG: isoprenylcysteine carboxylmethyltransferase family protein [Candidatus Helarchaeota archaeon]|nr:isoprenylcysteine carboxylmethyltransferase family protein [Candidatus Helarchaeota archaeon]
MSGKEPEMPKSHLIHVSSAIIMVSLLIIDSLLNITTWILEFIPWYINLALCVFFLVFAMLFILRSHKALFGGYFKSVSEPSTLITDGIFAQVRHPMYVGIILIHLSFVLLVGSLIGFGVWIAIIILYNWLANYEEDYLDELYGEQYQDYKKHARKWLPG